MRGIETGGDSEMAYRRGYEHGVIELVINNQDGGVCVRHRSYSRLKDQGNEPLSRFAGLARPCQF